MVFSQVNTSVSKSTIRFSENKSQWESSVLYRAQLDGGALFLEKSCFTYSFYDRETLREHHHPQGKNEKSQLGYGYDKLLNVKKLFLQSHAFRMTFVNANEDVQVSGKKITPDYSNYFIGKDQSKWAGGVKNYLEVNYDNLYSGIDLQVLGLENSLKYNFYVKPSSDAGKIKLLYEGLSSIKIINGTLQLTTILNEIVEQRPVAYQWKGSERINIPCEFVLENDTVSFKFPSGYDRSFELIIDPVLIFAASSGSLADNFGMTATYDAEGNLFSGGTVFDQGYPITLGAYDTTFNGATAYGRTDVVITKYDSSGTFLQYSTYLGGTISTEIVTSLVVNDQNELLLYGATGSADFPVTANAYDTTFGGGDTLHFVCNGTFFDHGTDIYVSKFNSTGTSLLASTYIGGSLNDGVNTNNTKVLTSACGPASFEYPVDSLQYNYGDQFRGEINVDKFGNVCIASSSRSSDFPIVNGFDSSLGGIQDAVVFKLDNNLTQLIWSTYLGGSDNDAGYALAIDDSSNVYVTGGTRSADFPSTAGALQTAYNGGKADGFITKIKNDGSVIEHSTYWGTSSYDQSYFVQLDKFGDVYVVGQTEGVMPITAGVYNNPNSGQFITKMNDSLTTLLFSTVFGNGSGSPNISPSAFLVDRCENVYVSGWGGNIITGPPTFGMPLTADAIQSSTDGFNFYLIVLATDAASLYYATYFGGGSSLEHVDGGTSRFDKKGIVYQSVCAGCGGNDDFPVSPGAWPNTGANVNHNTNCNNGVFKFDFQVPLVLSNFTVDSLQGCTPLTITFENQSYNNATYMWDFGEGDTTSVIEDPIRTYTVPGTYLAQLYVNNPTSCNIVDTAFYYVTVYPDIEADFDFETQPCSNKVLFYDSSAVAPVSWLWHFDDGDSSTVQNPEHTYASKGIYDVQLITSTNKGCKDTVIVELDFSEDSVSVSSDVTICKDNSTQLSATGGELYSWEPASSLSNATISNPIATPSTETTYTVNISSVNMLGDTCVKALTTIVGVLDPSLYSIDATTDDDTIVQGGSTMIHAITDSPLSVRWLASSGAILPSDLDISVSPEITTTYTVSILDSLGCSKSATVTIYVPECDPANVFVPNTFTPNGDGKNDILYVRGVEVTELYFAVYNRWGQLVFETIDISKGWDGIYTDMKSDPVVFAWYLRAKCYSGEDLEKKGNVTLIR